ncbi:MAG: hypothetical protein ACO35B_06455 [Luminiphilus sp.]
MIKCEHCGGLHEEPGDDPWEMLGALAVALAEQTLDPYTNLAEVSDLDMRRILTALALMDHLITMETGERTELHS